MKAHIDETKLAFPEVQFCADPKLGKKIRRTPDEKYDPRCCVHGHHTDKYLYLRLNVAIALLRTRLRVQDSVMSFCFPQK